MQKPCINDLPVLVKSGSISKKEGAKIIWEEIYTNPNEYGLKKLEKDDVSDFLLYLSEKFEVLFDKFIPGKCSFKTFIYGCISNYKNNYSKKIIYKSLNERLISQTLKSKYEDELLKYQHEESIFVNSLKPEYSKPAKKTIRAKVAKLEILVLAMKACNELDDSMIEKISSFTKINKNYIYQKIQEAKNLMETKNKKIEDLIAKRNNSYFFHRQYQHLLEETNPESRLYKKFLEKYTKKTNSWIKQNFQLKNSFYMKPSNKEVGDLLGIKPRTVAFYIEHAKRNREKIQI